MNVKCKIMQELALSLCTGAVHMFASRQATPTPRTEASSRPY